MYHREGITEFLLSKIDFDKAKTFLDIGCGRGVYLIEAGKRASIDSKLYGIDNMAKVIDAAQSLIQEDQRYQFNIGDVENGLDFEDESMDVIFSCNVLECINNKPGLLKEIHRVLKPDGICIMAHFDWDTQIYNAIDKTLFRKVIAAYNDWQQPWMNSCDAWMGRRLHGVFNGSGLFIGKVFSHVLLETEYREGFKGYSVLNDEIAMLVDNQILDKDEFDAFRNQLEELALRGEYFYSINMYAYVGHKSRNG
ncbi:MAG: methyltransferase domain-containing protein [Clostridia bacterium]|nr:methyltransferase domain-containing protein [Clostridia bacterium]